MIFIALFINKRKHTPFDLDQRLPSQCNLSNIRGQRSSLGFESSFLESELARIQRCTLGAGGGGYGGTKERKIAFGRFPRAFPPSTRAALDFSLPQMLGLCSALATGTCGSRTRLRPAVIERSRRGFLQSRGGAQRTAARVGSSLPRPRAREGGGTEPQGGHARAPARSARASGGENPVTASPSAFQPELPLVSFLGDVHLLPTCFFFLAPKILLPPMGSTRSLLLTLA